jgi:ribulose-5-phosphate 4-epimerase/fuculose-1-phosphate aldolase
MSTFITACREAAARGLVRCSSGNLSLRLDCDRMLIKASRSWMGRLTPADVSVCRIADGAVLNGKKPSAETGFHAGILRERPDVNAVFHFQSPYATVLACRRSGPPRYEVLPEIPFYIGPIARVPFFPPGTPALAAAVVAAMRDHDLAVLDHHGQVTAARDLDHAIQNAEFFELACQVIVLGGKDVTPLPERSVKHLLVEGLRESGTKI